MQTIVTQIEKKQEILNKKITNCKFNKLGLRNVSSRLKKYMKKRRATKKKISMS